jgi:DNA invertase Pin-like site-specific DNA recombinase
LIREHTLAGLEVARARGRCGGRPPAITPEQLDAARAMRVQEHTMSEIVKALGVPRSTLYRHLSATGKSEQAA